MFGKLTYKNAFFFPKTPYIFFVLKTTNYIYISQYKLTYALNIYIYIYISQYKLNIYIYIIKYKLTYALTSLAICHIDKKNQSKVPNMRHYYSRGLKIKPI